MAGCPGLSSRGAPGAMSRGCMGGGSRSGQWKLLCALSAPVTNHLSQVPRDRSCEYQPERLAVLCATVKLHSWLALALQAPYTANKCQSPDCHPAAGSLVGCSCMVAMSVPCLVPPQSSITDLTCWLDLRPASLLQTCCVITGFLADSRILVIIMGPLWSSCLDQWDCALGDGATPVCLAMALRFPSLMEQPALLLPDNGQKKLISGILEMTKQM